VRKIKIKEIYHDAIFSYGWIYALKDAWNAEPNISD